jgi:hypothetical protein
MSTSKTIDVAPPVVIDEIGLEGGLTRASSFVRRSDSVGLLDGNRHYCLMV